MSNRNFTFNPNGASDYEKQQLERAFAILDKDGNGMIDKEEMLDFLARNGVDEEHRVQIVDELFNKLDADGNGAVDVSEFVNEYIDTKNQLVKRE